MSRESMYIRFSAKQVALMKKHIGPSVAAHHAEDCIFPGFLLCIDSAPAFGESAELHIGNQVIDLGSVEMEYVPET
jgi:hypothetical protein